MSKPGYNQSNSTHHASAMQAHRGGSFFYQTQMSTCDVLRIAQLNV
jgi:hypothetical protein